jgi:1-deoxy-D-xylulose-5-phosphate synthase
VPVQRIGVPDILVDHASPEQSFASLGMTSGQISDRVLANFAFSKERSVVNS